MATLLWWQRVEQARSESFFGKAEKNDNNKYNGVQKDQRQFENKKESTEKEGKNVKTNERWPGRGREGSEAELPPGAD